MRQRLKNIVVNHFQNYMKNKLNRINNISNNSENETGFSLLEMSVVLVISATIIVSLLLISNAQHETLKADITKKRIETISQALVDYAIESDRLPCPADPKVALSSASIGVSADCDSAVANGSVEVGSGSEAVRIGIVPTRSLNLPDRYLYDGWNNRFTYAVVKESTLSTGNITLYSTAATDGVIIILDASGNQVTPANTNSINMLLIVSHGKDGAGAYIRNSTASTTPITCNAATSDGQNCDRTNVSFRDNKIIDSVTTAKYYFDYIKWQTRDDLLKITKSYY